MSQTPAVAVHEAAARAAVEELKKRLAPAVLKDTSDNGTQVALYIKKRGLDFTNPDHLGQAVKALLFKGLLEWEPGKEPKVLQAAKELTGPAKIKSAAQAESEFAAKKAAGDKLDAQRRADEASDRQINDLIKNFQLIDHRTQRVAHGLTEQAKANLRTYVAKAKERGESLQVIAKTVSSKIDDLYKADERSRERV